VKFGEPASNVPAGTCTAKAIVTEGKVKFSFDAGLGNYWFVAYSSRTCGILPATTV